MKARILAVARRIFGEYGFHGTTMRMIAREVGIDISTLHYHWGEKKDLYEAVILDINTDLRQSLIDVETIIHGKPLAERMAIAIDVMTDYLFANPEVSNLILLRYFGKTRHESSLDFKVPEFTGEIARSMGLTPDAKKTHPAAMMEVWTVMNALHHFVSGENFFRPMTGLQREDYILTAKETLKFVLIPAFVRRDQIRSEG
ncbi:MAG: TetR/AcrR family transcriptional regulator [Syntrophus sp. (in: bacteria)]|nr:TetR/AcrR family transcriptional regulator [Syntrophus sp. (in: bacteria)]